MVDERRIERSKGLAETHPHLKGFVAFLDELNKESARGAVLISLSMLDDLLLRVLEAFLMRGKPATSLLTGFNAPLGTLSARAAAAVSMGLISDKEFQEAGVLRKIRNEFAHGIHVSFDSPIVEALCRKLTMDAKPYGDIVWDARGAFTTSAVGLIMNLTNRPHYAGQKALTYQHWPT